MRPADRAWLTLAVGVLTWDALCPADEMLSDASARYAGARPILSRTVIVYTAGHLMHVWPANLDLFTLSARLFGR